MTDYIELGKRLRACKHWRWTSGMRAKGSRNLPGASFRVVQDRKVFIGEWSEAIPDLSDPATRGCVLQLIREAWGDPVFSVSYAFRDSGWKWFSQLQDCPVLFDSEEETLINALEAAQ